MNTIEKIQELLRELPDSERAILLRVVAGGMHGRVTGIESAPEVCGGDACVIRTRIPIWLLEKWRRLGVSDAQLLKMYPSLRQDDLVNAWAYVATNARDIDEQIRAQEDA